MGTKFVEVLESRRFLSVTAAAVEPVATAAVFGNVFRDANRNGVRESTEVGQANIKVYLDYNNNGTRDGDAEPIAITNSTGRFRFENAKAPETIPVRLLLTGTGFYQTRPAANAARVAKTTAGANVEVENFGVAEPAPTPTPIVTVLTGIVYTDLDRNGVRADTEKGRANVSVFIDANNDGVRQNTESLAVTNAEGRYRFEKIDSGPKTLRLLLVGTNLEQTQPTGNGPVLVTVVNGTTTQAAPFGVAERRVTPPPTVGYATVRGTVFEDLDRDGVREAGEFGFPNVRVYLDLDNDRVRDATEPTVLTNGIGRYVFERAPVSPELHIRLDLTEKPQLRQSFPLANNARVVKTVAGATYGDLDFGVYKNPERA